jgi:hypothetical protein
MTDWQIPAALRNFGSVSQGVYVRKGSRAADGNLQADVRSIPEWRRAFGSKGQVGMVESRSTMSSFDNPPPLPVTSLQQVLLVEGCFLSGHHPTRPNRNLSRIVASAQSGRSNDELHEHATTGI